MNFSRSNQVMHWGSNKVVNLGLSVRFYVVNSLKGEVCFITLDKQAYRNVIDTDVRTVVT